MKSQCSYIIIEKGDKYNLSYNISLSLVNLRSTCKRINKSNLTYT